jgi:hypothetical protein
VLRGLDLKKKVLIKFISQLKNQNRKKIFPEKATDGAGISTLVVRAAREPDPIEKHIAS